jgi:hypothetical protein
MIVDCMTCPVRGQRCDDCVVTLLLGRGSGQHPVPELESFQGPKMSPELHRPHQLQTSPEPQRSPVLQTSDELLRSDELQRPPELQTSIDLPLDAAENRVVSMFVGAGLVDAGAVSTLRARRAKMQQWGSVRHVS